MTITCENCGVCCEGQAFAPLSGAMLDGIELPPAMLDDLNRGLDANPCYEGVCVWFDRATKGCKHYDLRPNVCRNLDVGDEDCLRIRKYGLLVAAT